MVLIEVTMINFSFSKKISFLILIFITFLIPLNLEGMDHERELDKMKIFELYENWDIAVEASDIDGYVNSLDENVILIPPDGPTITGRDSYRNFLGPVFEVATYKLEQKTPRDIKFYGDFATVEYNIVVYINFLGNEKSVPSEGTIFSFPKKFI